MPVFCGGPERIRTADLCNANAALYQLSYRPGKPAQVRHLQRQISAGLLTVHMKYASSVLEIFLVHDELSQFSIESVPELKVDPELFHVKHFPSHEYQWSFKRRSARSDEDRSETYLMARRARTANRDTAIRCLNDHW